MDSSDIPAILVAAKQSQKSMKKIKDVPFCKSTNASVAHRTLHFFSSTHVFSVHISVVQFVPGFVPSPLREEICYFAFILKEFCFLNSLMKFMFQGCSLGGNRFLQISQRGHSFMIQKSMPIYCFNKHIYIQRNSTCHQIQFWFSKWCHQGL